MSRKIKYIRTKMFFGENGLYDAMNALCNPSGEDSGVRYTYKDQVFSLSDTIEEYFDMDGNLTRKVHVSGLKSQDTYWDVSEEYHEEGKEIIKAKGYSLEFIKDDKGNTTEIRHYDGEGRLEGSGYIDIEYNESGQKTKEHIYGYHESDKTELYEYDNMGRVSKRTTVEKNGLISWIFTYKYDDQGRLLRDEEAFYGDGEWDEHQDIPRYTLISSYTREFDNEGKCTLEYLCCEDGMQSDELTLWEYKYWDDEDNG